MRLFSTPTQANHLNPGECQAGDLQKLALAKETYTAPAAAGRALGSAVRYRNEEKQARGKGVPQECARRPPSQSEGADWVQAPIRSAILRSRASSCEETGSSVGSHTGSGFRATIP